MTTKAQHYEVTYTKRVGGESKLITKARSEKEALANAKNTCHTGSDFRNATIINKGA
jgi:hypothetical protein